MSSDTGIYEAHEAAMQLLDEALIKAAIVNTGGNCYAIEIPVEGGYLLIGDAEDGVLTPEPAEWYGLGLYETTEGERVGFLGMGLLPDTIEGSSDGLQSKDIVALASFGLAVARESIAYGPRI